MARLIGIAFIWLGSTIAWVILGTTLVARTGDASSSMGHEVSRLWGPEVTQQPPSALYRVVRTVKEEVTERDRDGVPYVRTIEREVIDTFTVPVAATDAKVDLALEHRRKGLLWFPTYGVDFAARYEFVNPSDDAQTIDVTFPLDLQYAIYDGFRVLGPGEKVVDAEIASGGAKWSERFAPGERRTYFVSFSTRGTRTWSYGSESQGLAGGGRQVRDFHLTVRTDFRDVDFPPGSLSPSQHGPVSGGWEGSWNFESLVAGSIIALELPGRTNPGPLASRITFFAPIGLLFFFFVVAVLSAARGEHIHPMNYFLFAAAFFAFHLLFAYLVDHLAIFPSFWISAAVSILLVVSYARLFVSRPFTWVMGGAQLVYLVLFSFTFFWTGFTGLAITVGAVLSLFVIMQITGRVDWRRAMPPGGGGGSGTPPATGEARAA